MVAKSRADRAGRTLDMDRQVAYSRASGPLCRRAFDGAGITGNTKMEPLGRSGRGAFADFARTIRRGSPVIERGVRLDRKRLDRDPPCRFAVGAESPPRGAREPRKAHRADADARR